MMMSAYLKVALSEYHIELFNPCPVDFLMGSIIQDIIGRRGKNKISKRRLNIVAEIFSRYSCVMNKPSDIVHINKYNQLASVIVSIQHKNIVIRRIVNRRRRRRRHKRLQINMQVWGRGGEHDLMPGMKEYTYKGLDHLFKLTHFRQRNLLHYFFGDRTMVILSMNKD